MPTIDVRIGVFRRRPIKILVGESARRAFVVVVGDILGQGIERVELSPLLLELRANRESAIKRFRRRLSDLDLSEGRNWASTGPGGSGALWYRGRISQAVERPLSG